MVAVDIPNTAGDVDNCWLIIMDGIPKSIAKVIITLELWGVYEFR